MNLKAHFQYVLYYRLECTHMPFTKQMMNCKQCYIVLSFSNKYFLWDVSCGIIEVHWHPPIVINLIVSDIDPKHGGLWMTHPGQDPQGRARYVHFHTKERWNSYKSWRGGGEQPCRSEAVTDNKTRMS